MFVSKFKLKENTMILAVRTFEIIASSNTDEYIPLIHKIYFVEILKLANAEK